MTASHKSKLFNSSPLDPCPVCGRDDAGGDCRISDDGALVLCHHGSTFSPPSGLKSGDVVLGKDLQSWAYDKETGDGRCSVFTLHKERALRLVEAVKPAITIARLSPEAKPAKGIGTAAGTFFSYSEGQRVQRQYKDDGEKIFWPQTKINGSFITGKGEAPWPLYGEALALASGGWPLELEGEKCCDIASSIGLVAISQPGFLALSQELVAPRYERLRGAGVEGIVYLADNNEAGKRKAIALQAVAEAIGFPFVLLAAEDLWPDLPQGGSIDDLTAEELAGAAEKIEKAASLFQKPAKAPATTAKKPEKKEKAAPAADDDKATAKAIAALLEKLLDATLAEDQPLVDALKSRAWGYQLTREVLQERLLALWGQKKGLLTGAKAPARSRTIGKADPGPGLQQLQPGFALKNDLHVLAADGGAGKTLMTLELATSISIGSGFLDQQEGSGQKKGRVLFVATDGGASAWAMLNDYCDALQTVERGADIEVWAEDPEEGEAAWNVSLPNLERLAQRMAKGDLVAVIVDTANSCFQSAGISPYTGPVDQYLRLLKAIVCPSAALWINCHTTRSGQGMKAVAGHPAWQEVPSAVHRIERLKKEEGEAPVYKWTVEKFRGESPRSFNYHRLDGEFQLVGGAHYQENIGDLLLKTIHRHQQTPGLLTKPSALAEATKKGSNSVWCALQRLRQQRLVKSQGTGNRITEKGLARLAELEKQAPKEETPAAAEEFF
ncbi:AAA family ATPase [Cyanobium sp. BA20m-14]|uniref:AAA family ATPase n=1 Tax=Cyanobium sp. BA20m-14 TaxID=2823703 RepID=UPI0020CC6357|nr:AAA family ATPase [Cyanobium sp. BA20m-14]MCP9914609.1 AAA family ATPase [Cyanobium sp. BA20m-14]